VVRGESAFSGDFVMNPKWRTVKLPAKMVDRCHEIVTAHPECGWDSVAAFVRDAVRDHPYWQRYVFQKRT